MNKPRKITNRDKIDQVFSYAYSCVICSTNTLTGEMREERLKSSAARDYFYNRMPHSGMWELSDIKFAFTWEDADRCPNREVHRVQIICSGIPL